MRNFLLTWVRRYTAACSGTFAFNTLPSLLRAAVESALGSVSRTVPDWRQGNEEVLAMARQHALSQVRSHPEMPLPCNSCVMLATTVNG